MKTAVIGSRSFRDFKALSEALQAHQISLVISGGAKGTDSMAEEYAMRAGLPTQIFLPDYRIHGKRAPIVRNCDIVKACEVLIAFWDGKSPGTRFTIEFAKKQGKKIFIYLVTT